MFYPDYFQAIAEPVYQAQQFRDRTARQWEEVRPRLIDAGVMVLEVALLAMVATYDAGVTAGKAYRWFMPRFQAAIDAFRDYRETPWYESWEACDLQPEFTLPNPSDYFGGEYLPDAPTFEEFVAICREPEPEPGDNTPLESSGQSEDQEFDPIPEIAVDDIPTAPDLRELGYLEEITPVAVKTERRRRGRPRKEK